MVQGVSSAGKESGNAAFRSPSPVQQEYMPPIRTVSPQTDVFESPHQRNNPLQPGGFFNRIRQAINHHASGITIGSVLGAATGVLFQWRFSPAHLLRGGVMGAGLAAIAMIMGAGNWLASAAHFPAALWHAVRHHKQPHQGPVVNGFLMKDGFLSANLRDERDTIGSRFGPHNPLLAKRGVLSANLADESTPNLFQIPHRVPD
jgi:hypothetical protein